MTEDELFPNAGYRLEESRAARNQLGQPVGEPLANWRPAARPSGEPMNGRYCRLEHLQPARHAAALYSANALDVEGRNWTYLPYGPFPDFPSYLAWVAEVSVAEDPLFYAVVDSQSGLASGVASFLRISPAVGSIEVGHIHFSPRLQRRPAATEAMYLMMQRAFARGYRRCEWKCDALNLASRSSAARLGFSFEGVFRQASVYKGRNRDTAWYAMIDLEWPAVAAALQSWHDPGNFDPQGRQRTRLGELTAPRLHQPAAATRGFGRAIERTAERGEKP